MSWNGSGTFSRIHDWVTDKANAIDILATRHDAEDDSFAAGIQACITKNNESKPTADFAPNADATYSLGTSSLKWINAFLSGTIKFVGTSLTTTLAFTDPTGARTVTIPDKTGTVMMSTGDTMTGLLNQAKGADIASATTVDLTAATGNLVHITGTTATTGFTMNAGQKMDLIADAAWPLTYNATTMKLNGGADYTCAAGDRIHVEDDGTLTIVNITKQDGSSVYAGKVVQVVNSQDGAVATGTTVMVIDDSIPQITEGDEYLTLAITPKSATSKLKIEVTLMLSHSTAETSMMTALFQDATANALAVGNQYQFGTADVMVTTSFVHYMTSGTTSATTFRVRAGGEDAGTTTLNGVAAGRLFGGVAASSITITEIAA